MPNNLVIRCSKHQWSDITTYGRTEGALAKTGAYFKTSVCGEKKTTTEINGWDFIFFFFEWVKTSQSEHSVLYF